MKVKTLRKHSNSRTWEVGNTYEVSEREGRRLVARGYVEEIAQTDADIARTHSKAELQALASAEGATVEATDTKADLARKVVEKRKG